MAKDPKGVAGRLAKALQETLLETKGEKVVELVRQQLADLLSISESEAGVFFANPVFSIEEKQAVLEGIFKKHPVEPGLERFFQLVVSLGQTELLPDILKAYDDAERGRRNEIVANVRTALPLDKDQEARLVHALNHATGKNVLIDVQQDPELIGGVIAQVGSVVYDASIQGYLNRMQEEF